MTSHPPPDWNGKGWPFTGQTRLKVRQGVLPPCTAPSCRRFRSIRLLEQLFAKLPAPHPQTCSAPQHQDFHGLLQYAGMAWTFDAELASEEDIKAYWENVPPVWEVHGAVTAGALGVARHTWIERTMAAIRRWRTDSPPTKQHLMLYSCHGSAKSSFGYGCSSVSQFSTLRYTRPSSHRRTPTPAATTVPGFPPCQLSENVTERDICGMVLSVAVQLHQPFLDETGVKRAVFAEDTQPQPQPQPRPCTVKTAASKPSIENAERQISEPTTGGSAGLLPVKAEEVDADQICLENVMASTDTQKSLLPEMLRVQEWFQT